MKKENFKIQNLIRVYNVVLLLIVLAGILYISIFAMNLISENERLREQEMLDNWINVIDRNLENNAIFANNLVVNNTNVAMLTTALSQPEKIYAAVEIQQDISDYALLEYGMNEMFFYSDKGEANAFLSTNHSSLTNRKAVNDYIQSLVISYDRDKQFGYWQLHRISGASYLVYLVENNGCFAGCYCSVEYLLNTISSGEGERLFVTDSDGFSHTVNYMNGEPLDLRQDHCTTADGIYYRQISVPSKWAPFYLVEHVPKTLIESSLIHVRNFLILLGIIVMIMIVLVSKVFAQLFYRPIRNLVAKMIAISEGDFQTEIEDENSFQEIRVLNHTFNTMIQEIRHLKIDIYEEQLKEKEITLQYYQLQIRPHFLVNVLNSVYAMAEMREYDNIREMCMYLIRYFRYLYDKNNRIVLLREELKHAEDYAGIQRIRMNGSFEFTYEVEEGCDFCMVPPLTIQTFIENSIKYGINLQKKDNRIHLWVYRSEEMFVIEIHDNGPGYPKEVMEAIAQGQCPRKERKKDRIGIYNVLLRLELIFDRQAGIRLENDQGAKTILYIPVISE